MSDLDKLKALAMGVGSGPWAQHPERGWRIEDAEGSLVGDVFAPTHVGSMEIAAYIAAANPAAILALIERVRAAEADAKRFRWLEGQSQAAQIPGEQWWTHLISSVCVSRRSDLRAAIDDVMASRAAIDAAMEDKS